MYTVSRTKIRAALVMLSKDKLIEIIPDKGAFVSRPSVQEAREVFSVRRVLEAEVVRLFIASATPADYQMLEQHIRFERAALRESTTTGRVREKLLGDFHVVLAEAAGNQTLAQLVRDLVARSSLIAHAVRLVERPALLVRGACRLSGAVQGRQRAGRRSQHDRAPAAHRGESGAGHRAAGPAARPRQGLAGLISRAQLPAAARPPHPNTP